MLDCTISRIQRWKIFSSPLTNTFIFYVWGVEACKDHSTMICVGIKRNTTLPLLHSHVLRTHFNAHSQYLHRGIQNSRITSQYSQYFFLGGSKMSPDPPPHSTGHHPGQKQEAWTKLRIVGLLPKTHNCGSPTQNPQSSPTPFLQYSRYKI